MSNLTSNLKPNCYQVMTYRIISRLVNRLEASVLVMANNNPDSDRELKYIMELLVLDMLITRRNLGTVNLSPSIVLGPVNEMSQQVRLCSSPGR